MLAPHSEDSPVESPAHSPRTAPESRPPRRNGKARKDILEAAIHEFARQGFAGASTLKIARRAETKQPLIHYHYGTKQGLWQAAVDVAFSELKVTFELITTTAGELEEIEVLKLMLRTLSRFAFRHPLHVDIMQQEMASQSERTEYLMTQHLGPMYEHLDTYVAAAVSKGQIKNVPAPLLTSMMFGAITQYSSSGRVIEALDSAQAEDQDRMTAQADWLIEIIFNGLAQETA